MGVYGVVSPGMKKIGCSLGAIVCKYQREEWMNGNISTGVISSSISSAASACKLLIRRTALAEEYFHGGIKLCQVF